MPDFLDEKEKRYIECFGEVVLVAHDVITEPHVDVYIFSDDKGSEYYYLTKGMEEAGFREIFMVTKKQEEWPAFFLQAACSYQIQEKKTIKEMETYDNVEKIKDCGNFKNAIFLGIDLVGFDKDEVKEKLGLENAPLYAFPITDKELEYSLNNSREALLDKIIKKTSFPGSVKRKSVI
ncbi:suppressor of fused domain protein [Candidatus Microgenomates bacterium]|nr:suppressor of fused domain protein [Candidatus Microgenomates bacterium]